MKKEQEEQVALSQYERLSRDIIQKLTGKNGPYWLWAYRKVSRSENPFEVPEDETERWKVFYLKFFGIEVDFSKVYVPEKKTGFATSLFFPEGLIFDDVISVYRGYVRTEEGERFSFHTSGPQREQRGTFEDSLVGGPGSNVRTCKYASYAVRISDVTWQDRFNERKIVDLAEDGVKFLNPKEYFIYDLYWMWTTGKGPVAAPGRLSGGTAILCGCKMQRGSGCPVYPTAHWDYHPDSYFYWEGGEMVGGQPPRDEAKLALIDSKGLGKKDRIPVVIEVIT